MNWPGDTNPVVNRIKRISTAKQFDVLLFAAVLTLTAVGYYFLYIVRPTFNGTDGLTDASMRRQLLAIIIGIVGALFLSSIDYQYYQVPSYIGYIGSAFLLLVTALIGAGGQSTGTRGWIQMLGVSGANFQPSEIAKITFVVVSASFLERIVQRRAAKADYVKLAFYAALPVGLVLLQKDTGTATVFLFMFFTMLFVSGLKYRYIFSMIGAALVSLPLLWVFVLKDYQKMRIVSFLNPELDITNTGYQANLARSAIGAGELFGRQLEDAGASRFSVVPTRHTDFIFTVVAEKVGFVGCVLFILLFVLILLRCYYVAASARDRYGSFMVTGLASMLAFHFIENISMCIGLMPITGIPLPFVSYGGTSMITNYIAIGIILSVSITREKTEPRRGDPDGVLTVTKVRRLAPRN
ncbi:MAG: rod shape-determining protein RodA [Clostridiales bacterium]|jgi:rod shape determining protein RodA|nr:rod shape-determining protein RodA [Clostridiales bacterium]